MDQLFAAFHDELEKIASREKTLTEQRNSARRNANFAAGMLLAGSGADIIDSRLKARKVTAAAATKAAKKGTARRVAGKAVGAGLGLAGLGLIAGSLKRRRPSPELKRLYALPSAKFTHPVT